MIERQRGFTLVEIIVAFVLLALVLSTGFEIFSSGLRRAGELDDYSRAIVLAQSKLAAAGLEEPLQEGASQGESEDRRYRWSLVVTPTDEGMPPKDQPQPGPGSYILYRVESRVEWQGGDQRPRHYALSTLSVGQRK